MLIFTSFGLVVSKIQAMRFNCYFKTVFGSLYIFQRLILDGETTPKNLVARTTIFAPFVRVLTHFYSVLFLRWTSEWRGWNKRRWHSVYWKFGEKGRNMSYWCKVLTDNKLNEKLTDLSTFKTNWCLTIDELTDTLADWLNLYSTNDRIDQPVDWLTNKLAGL